jgi:hypothetical protein
MVMPRELLKFREGDCGLKIKKDGALEVAGVDDSGGMINKEGRVNPALLFAAAWARRDPKVFELLVQNFKESVREGFFGQEAKVDYEKALKAQVEHSKSLQDQNIAVKQDVPFMKPEETVEYGNEFETHYDKPITDVASGAVTFEQPKPGVTTWPGQEAATMSAESTASGAVTFEKPAPMTVDEQLDRRDT